MDTGTAGRIPMGGASAGAAVDLALGCDMHIAAESATFNTMFYDRAVVPLSSITYLLTQADPSGQDV